ncbi:MAG: Holliday junction resolvase-like protein [Candidatus Odinarchaeia archaeon]
MELYLILSIIITFLIIVIYILFRKYQSVLSKLKDRESQQKSLSTIYGKISEQWFPLMPGYPYDPKNFRFIGSPIDGIQFTDDKIIFCEFKLHSSKLSDTQKRIKELIKNKRVEWAEFRFNI